MYVVSVDVGRQQLRASFAAQRAAAKSVTAGPAALLLFYSAECGLKAAILDRQRLRSTSQLPEELRSHDLHRLAKHLGLPSKLCNRMRSCMSRREGAGQVPFSELHQAWRYGHALRGDAEEQAVAVLNDLFDWCQQELRA